MRIPPLSPQNPEVLFGRRKTGRKPAKEPAPSVNPEEARYAGLAVLILHAHPNLTAEQVIGILDRAKEKYGQLDERALEDELLRSDNGPETGAKLDTEA